MISGYKNLTILGDEIILQTKTGQAYAFQSYEEIYNFILNSNVSFVKGEKGDIGDQGDKGDTGVQGNQGIQGISGAIAGKGPKGTKGATGLPGAEGNIGIQGEQGDIGAQGDKGDKGLKGEPGDPGTPGNKGPKGTKGLQGDNAIPNSGSPFSYTVQKDLDILDQIKMVYCGVVYKIVNGNYSSSAESGRLIERYAIPLGSIITKTPNSVTYPHRYFISDMSSQVLFASNKTIGPTFDALVSFGARGMSGESSTQNRIYVGISLKTAIENDANTLTFFTQSKQGNSIQITPPFSPAGMLPLGSGAYSGIVPYENNVYSLVGLYTEVV